MTAAETYERMPYQFAGFGYQPAANPGPDWLIFVPLWFATLLAGGLLWLVWRKTRARIIGEPSRLPMDPC
jgi:hypothetical protein